MKRSFSFPPSSPLPLVLAGTGLIASTYGLVRLAYGLFLPDVQAELGLGVAAAGVVSAAASIVYCVGALVGFLVATRRARALVVASALSAAVGACGMAAAPDAWSFAVFAVLSSGGAGLASPALVALLQRNPSTRQRPGAQAVVNAGTGPGLVAAGLLALALAPNWRPAWVIAAVVTVAAAASVLVADQDAGEALPVRRPLPPPSWLAAHWRVLAAALLMGCGSAAVWNYGRSVLVQAGTGPAVSVTAWIALGAGGAAVVLTARWLERRRPAEAWVLTTGTVAVSSAALAAAPGNVPLALAACAAFGWGYTGASGALIAWTAQIDRSRAPAGTALLFITLILGQALGAGAVGALIPAAGHRPAFLVAALASAAAVVPALWSGRKVPAHRARSRPHLLDR